MVIACCREWVSLESRRESARWKSRRTLACCCLTAGACTAVCFSRFRVFTKASPSKCTSGTCCWCLALARLFTSLACFDLGYRISTLFASLSPASSHPLLSPPSWSPVPNTTHSPPSLAHTAARPCSSALNQLLVGIPLAVNYYAPSAECTSVGTVF